MHKCLSLDLERGRGKFIFLIGTKLFPNVIPFYQIFWNLLALPSQHCPFKPCFGHMQWFLTQIGVFFVVVSSQFPASLSMCDVTILDQQMCKTHDLVAWWPCPHSLSENLVSQTNTNAEFTGLRNLTAKLHSKTSCKKVSILCLSEFWIFIFF